MSNPVGRPLIFKTPEELNRRIAEYFEWAHQNNKPLTIGRLAVFLECDNKTINNYKHKDEFFPAIKKARQIIQSDKEERLNNQEGNVTGIIFDLKNNHSDVFMDRKYVEQTVIEKFDKDKAKDIDDKLVANAQSNTNAS
jgi:hypothetical protein